MPAINLSTMSMVSKHSSMENQDDAELGLATSHWTKANKSMNLASVTNRFAVARCHCRCCIHIKGAADMSLNSVCTFSNSGSPSKVPSDQNLTKLPN